ncbi:hypothetical protein BCR37DRAFT_384516 [Protomyces lactucae-debilis]|uniref:DNA/RNA-binding protein Alba-like domain-containing protein n=1 Tax=Protomyces lactucae-debilis TaxID=2754530 RepID=A0A1Y2ES68_PROLT|nr:uncharacterized protein BCR37DRAFT_384516 [Protomyces lactucae-debilis]ORY74382.1 hypothetical protein BCR37DRAFT_384516 [Protomyces lactucae-debilis]
MTSSISPEEARDATKPRGRASRIFIKPKTSIAGTVTMIQSLLFLRGDTDPLICITGIGKNISKCITIAEIVQRQATEPLGHISTLSKEKKFADRGTEVLDEETGELEWLEEPLELADTDRFMPRITIELWKISGGPRAQ